VITPANADRPARRPRRGASGEPSRCAAILLALLALLAVVTGCARGGSSVTPAAPELAGGPLPTTRVIVYADMTTSPPPDLAGYAQQTGQRDVAAAFVLAGVHGCDDPSWGGTVPVSDPRTAERIRALRDGGGTVTVVTGGAVAPYLETTCPDADSLTRAYERTLDTVAVNSLDVDLEAAVDPDRVAEALARLQQQRHTAVTLTLPVAGRDSALTAAGMDLLRALATRAVAVRTNIMAMNFPDPGPWAEAMTGAVDSATRQLAQIWPTADPAELHRRLGVTLMIGRNDMGMITTADDAETIVDHAREQGLGSVGMWSLARDSGTCPDAAAARPDCSGVTQDVDAFTTVLQGFA
jgi:chitinase